MGFLSKLWKGIKGRFKKIGKGIKKAFRSVGKFMDKVGIVGQIALMFVLPGIGNALMSTVSGWAGTMLGSSSAIVKGMGMVLNTAHKFATTVGNVYKTVTGAVTDFIGTAGKYIGSKVGIGDPMTLKQAWGTYTNEVMKNVTHIADPFKKVITINPRDTIGNLAKSSGISPKDFIEKYEFKNPELVNHMKGLAEQGGNVLANFTPSAYNEIEMGGGKILEVERKVDFWGRDKPSIPTPTVDVETDPVALSDDTSSQARTESLLGDPAKIGEDPEMFIDPKMPWEQEQPVTFVGQPPLELGERSTRAKIAKSIKDEGEVFVRGLPQRALDIGLQRVMQGDPPDYPAQVRGGTPDLFTGPTVPLAPLPIIEATGLEFYLAGNNTFANGMWGRPQYNAWIERGLQQARGGTYG